MLHFMRGFDRRTGESLEASNPFICHLGGGGTQTSTTVQQSDPRVWDYVAKNYNRAEGIANQGFQAYTGNPYAGLTTGGTPGTPGYYSGGEFTGYDEYGQPQYNPSQWVEGTPGTPGTTPTFNASNFVAPLTANQNIAINAAPNLLNAGQGATNAAVSGAAGLLNYRPQSIMPATANTNTAQATGYNASVLGNAPQASAYSANPANMNAAGYNAGLLGDAPQAQAANAAAYQTGPTATAGYNNASFNAANASLAGPAAQASYGPAALSTANGAQINRDSVGNVGANSGLGGIAGYQNPYTSQVVDAALGDIELQRQRALGGNQDAAIGARAFGGSRQGVADALTNEAYGRQAAQTAAQLRAAGFDTAAQLSQADAARAQQGQAANQAADLSVAGQNAGFNQQTGQFNASNANQLNLANAQNALNAGQFNAGQQNSLGQFNAGLQTGVNQGNAQAANQMGQFNAQNALNAGQFNASALNNMGQYNAGLLNQNAQFNAGNQQQANQYNSGLLANFALANQGAINQAGQFNAGNQQAANAFNAGNQQQANLANAGAQNAASQFNTGLLSQYGLANQNALNQAGQYNAGVQNAASLANMAALNQGNQFNANAINQAQAQNQQAGLSGAQINAGAAGLLGNLGQQQQSMYGTGLSGLLQTGALGQQNQQAGLDAAYQEFLRQINQPYTGQSLINQSLGLLPQGGTTTQTGPAPDNTGSILGGIGTIASAAAIF